MGPGDRATPQDLHNAYHLGQLIARQGWVLLTGGRNAGVMEAASQGAKSENGLTLGILPGSDTQNLSTSVDIAIITGLGNARNVINVLSSHVIVACGMGAGTASEVAFAIKLNKPVILLTQHPEAIAFFTQLAPNQVYLTSTPEETLHLISQLLSH